ncbi:helicase-related protein [Verrucomicrobiaceae bacterium 227]
MPACTPSIYEVFDHQKTDLLISLIKASPEMKSVVVFLRSRENVHLLTSALNSAGLATDSVHGTKKQELRERTVREFLAEKFRVLVATESVMREVDLSTVAHIVYFEIHERDADFLRHLESAKEVLTFITQDQLSLLPKLNQLVDGDIPHKKLEGFPYATQPKNKRGVGGGNKTQSKPLQHKKPKLKNKGPRRKTGRTRKR